MGFDNGNELYIKENLPVLPDNVLTSELYFVIITPLQFYQSLCVLSN